MSRRSTKRGIQSNSIVQRFVPLAREYCKLIESGTRDRIKLLRGCGEMLPELLSLALRLPEVETSRLVINNVSLAGAISNGHSLSPERRKRAEASPYLHAMVAPGTDLKLLRRIRRLLGTSDFYRSVFNPYNDTHSIGHTLSDDLVDVWHDLKSALLIFDVGDEESRRYAVWSWRFLMMMHWGSTHASSALKPILYALTACEDEVPWEMGERKKRRHKCTR